MATPMAIKRLTKEFKDLERNPVPYIEAHPCDENILDWYFILTGPPDTPYTGGTYMGMLLFHKNYPFEPPGIKVITPSGRFVPNKKICLSISDYHRESWNPSFSVGTILNGLLSFMTSEESTAGGMSATVALRREYAIKSHAYNMANQTFRKEFPDYYKDAAITVTEKLGKRKLSDGAVLNERAKIGLTGKNEIIDLEAEEQEKRIRENEVVDVLESEKEDDFNFFDDDDAIDSGLEGLDSGEEDEDDDVVEIVQTGKPKDVPASDEATGTENDAIVID